MALRPRIQRVASGSRRKHCAVGVLTFQEIGIIIISVELYRLAIP